MNNKITVIIPIYNASSYICSCLSSVLAQWENNFDVILIDDASSDDTLSIIKNYEAKHSFISILQNTENRGVSYSRNKGIRHTKTEWIVFLDADDQIAPDYFSCLCHQLSNAETISLLFGDYQQIDHSGKMIGDLIRGENKSQDDYRAELIIRNFIISTSGVAVKKSVIQKLGGFNELLTLSEDWDLWLKLSISYRLCYVPNMLTNIRRHDSNASKNINSMKGSAQEVLNGMEKRKLKSLILLRNATYAQNIADISGIYQQMSEWKLSFKLLIRAQYFCKTEPDIYFYLGLYWMKFNNHRLASYYFEKAIKICPLHYAAINNLAILKMKIKLELAKSYFSKLCEIKSGYNDAKHNLSLVNSGVTDISQFNITSKPIRKTLIKYKS